ncbi:MAG: hypothetical protein JRE64_15850 [Deltaproteobacteria bacterium]|nr:hypothetical protein [Deltaproteobacteria bacterium]
MKISLIYIVSIIFFIVLCSQVKAEVAGNCANCHTMHNSQGGSEMADYGPTSGVNPCLTRGDCIGCHAYDISGTDNVVNIDGSLVPQVWHSAATDLAAGNFKYIATAADDDTGHSVADVDEEGNASMFPPPGDQHTTGITATNFTCAGKYGCHGDRDVTDEITSIKGAHHADDGTIDGMSTGTSYRFLKGVLGLENPITAWRNVDATDHNEYKGATSPGTSSLTSPVNGTMSGFCAECHGFYHGSLGTETGGAASPWLRHPTDFVLPSIISKEYQYYNEGTGGTAAADYSILAPLARPNLATITSTSKINPGTDIIMCLSCHGAHATKYYKLMRWDNQANMSGCVICHTSKN